MLLGVIVAYALEFTRSWVKSYRKKTIAKIKKLGGDPQELDNIDKKVEEAQMVGG